MKSVHRQDQYMFSRSKRNRSVILAYHRVSDLATDPQLLAVSPKHFDEQLQYLKDNLEIVSIMDLGRSVRERRVPNNAVALTFDDGYADAVWNVQPALEKHGVAGTVFVTCVYVDMDYEFWWDELERLTLLNDNLPKRLELSIDGNDMRWEIGDEELRTEERWNVLSRSHLTARQRLYLDLHRILRPLNHGEKQRVFDQIAVSTGATRHGRSTHRTLSSVEVKRLASSGIVEVGSHGMTHSVLSRQLPEERRGELADSKRFLENVIGKTVSSFSYPFGGPNDIDRTTAVMVRRTGYDLACSTTEGVVTHRSFLHALPRFTVRDWSGKEFEDNLRRWFSG
jgi:peptidoglycan/xylan/chitin deacetylase (PgdA/CDA1 family)